MSVLRSLAFGLSLVLSSAALVGAPSALAGEGETAKIDFRAAEPDQSFSPCSGTSRVKVKVSADDQGQLEAVGVVFSEGEDVWSWKFKHDNDFSARGQSWPRNAMSTGPFASFVRWSTSWAPM